MDAAERRALATRNRQRMQRSSLSCQPVAPTPVAASTRHQGRQMAVGNAHRPPAAYYQLGVHDSSLEVHSRAIDAVTNRVKGSEVWKQQVWKEERAQSRALTQADPLPRPASAARTPRGPDHMRHVGRPSSPSLASREETIRRLRQHGHTRLPEQPCTVLPEHVASRRIGAHNPGRCMQRPRPFGHPLPSCGARLRR